MEKNITGFYTGCVKSGNIGDDILFHIFLSVLRECISKKFSIRCNSKECESWYSVDYIKNCNVGVIGGGSLFHPEEISYSIPIETYNPQIKVLFGTGISDSHNSHMSKKFLENFNYSELDMVGNNLMIKNIEISNSCNYGGLRGPLDVIISKKIKNNYEKGWIYDSGLLSYKFFKRDYKRLPNKDGKKFIGINICNVGSSNAFYKKNETNSEFHERLFKEIVPVCEHLIDMGFDIIFYQMDRGDEGVIKNIYDSLSNKDKAHYIEGDLSFSEILTICEMSEITISNRLHAAVLSLSVDTPTLNLMYGYKSVNFCESVGIINWSIPTNEKMTTDLILYKFKDLLEKKEDYISIVKMHKEKCESIYYDMFFDILEEIKIDLKEDCTIEYCIHNSLISLFKLRNDY
jgi:hypothetical protein